MLPVMNRNLWMPEVFNDFFDTDFMPRTNATKTRHQREGDRKGLHR